MEEETYRFLKTVSLVIVLILILMLIAMTTLAVFSLESNDKNEKIPQSPINIYKFEEKEVIREVTPVYEFQAPSNVQKEEFTQEHSTVESNDVNVYTTINIRTPTTSTYYPKYSDRFYYRSYPSHKVRLRYPPRYYYPISDVHRDYRYGGYYPRYSSRGTRVVHFGNY